MKRGKRSGGGAMVAAGLALWLQFTPMQAHEAIGGDARKSYLAKLVELQKTAQSGAAPGVRAAARFQIGVMLDEVRERLNQDIISHGRALGLEMSLLVKQLDALPYKLEYSSQTRLYRANLSPYRDAIALDTGGKLANAARFKIFKGQFYDSFTDDPIRPVAQSDAELLEMIGIGEALYVLRDPGLDNQEIGFILAMRYLQAQHSGALPRDQAQARFAQLLHEFRQRYAQSLKLATLEALSQ